MRTAVRFTFAFCLLAIAASLSFAQSTNSGDIRGTVSDSSGAAITGATVTLTNLDTGESKDFITNGNGIYDTVSTRPGNYNLTFAKAGFKKVTHGPVVLQVSVITVDASLEVGEVTQVVHVEDTGAPLLQTESGQQGTILEEKTINALPQIGAGITGNDWANFTIFLAGASSAPSQPASEGSGAYNAGDAVSLNGNLPMYTNILADGAVVVLPVSGNVDNSVFESVSEVQVTTSSFSAQYGIGGAVFNQISKSGSNTFHGSAYEFWQNDVLNARTVFSASNSKVPLLRYNEWGGSIGGPIIKNKLFFFFVRDKITNNGQGAAHVGTVPTLAERGLGTANPGQYDFSGLPTIYDPTSAAVGGTRTAFPGNIIPANRIDPVALKLLSYYPSPNTGAPGQPQNNFTITQTNANPNLRYFGRIDYDLSSKNRVTFSITQKDNPGKNTNDLPCPLNCFSGDIDGYNVQLSDTWTLSPTLVNEFRMGYTKQGNWFVPQTLGFDAASKLGLQYAKANIFPSMRFSGGVCCNWLQPGTNAIYIEHLYNPSDVMTLIRGKHILHFGVEVLMGDGNTTPWGNVDAGTFQFNGKYTQQNCLPSPPAPPGCVRGGSNVGDFLLGYAQSWSATNQAVTYMRLKSPQLFVQDDYKLRPNLTINLGLRYVATTGMSELHNAMGGFDPNLVNSFGTLGSMWFAGQNNRTTLQKPIYDIFLPRVGFAWSPGMFKNTTVRGGYGMYSYNFSEDTYGQGLGAGSINTSQGSATDPNNGTGPNPLINLNASAATAGPILNYVVGSPAARVPLTYFTTPPRGVTFIPYNVPVGRINERTLSVEHQFARDFAASVAYVGSHGYNLQFPTDINQVTSAAGMAAGVTGSNQSFRPFPLFAGIGGNYYNAISNYNSLQTAVQKRYTNGLTFQVNYVWSHFLDDQDSSGWGSRGGTQRWQIGNNPKANYANSNFDIPHALKGVVAYELPFGHGKAYLKANPVVDTLVGGWRISGTFIHQSGNPFTVYDSKNQSGSDAGTWYVNRVSNANSNIPAMKDQGISYFNPYAYTDATPGTFGTNGRNTLRGPRLTVVNMSLAKSIRFKERFGLELRADFVNALNHPSFEPPNGDLSTRPPNGTPDPITLIGPLCSASPTAPGCQKGFGYINASSGGSGGATVAPRSGQLSARFSF
jgi:Carboxypeptidase regulatory-like domain